MAVVGAPFRPLASPFPSSHSPMASSGLPSRTFHHHRLPSSAPSHPSREACVPCCLTGAVSRRRAALQLLSAGFLTAVSPPPPSLAARRGRIVVPPEDYATARTSVCLLPCALVQFLGLCICVADVCRAIALLNLAKLTNRAQLCVLRAI